MKVSACWIAKNEAENIRRSINSVKDIVDELVVVDTGSTDDTVKVSQEMGARTEFFEWIGDFSAARNYALDQVSGDIVFFLDADEWFPTPLTMKDRENIENVFLSNPEFEAIQLTINNLNSQGAVKAKSTGSRILRKGPNVCFQKRIHEQFLYSNGAVPLAAAAEEKWQIHHSGYIDEVFASKMVRNIELLEEAAKNSKDAEERHFQYCYLVREYFQHNQFQEALRCLKIVLAEPDMLRRHCFVYGHGFAPLFYHMMIAGKKMRESVSRREIQRKIVETFKRNLPTYPGSATVDLFYEHFFDCKEDKMLARIDHAMGAARKIPDSSISFYHDAEAMINNPAAMASFRRGRFADAVEYAVKSFKSTEHQNSQALHVLLSCLRGQPTSEIILFLNSQFNLENPKSLEFLSKGTRMQGFRDIYAYYLDKCIKAEIATKGDYLYLLILYGKYTEAVEMAKSIHEDATSDTVQQIIFLAAVCSGDKQYFLDNKAIMSKYDDVLEAYFSKRPFETVSGEKFAVLAENFSLIALAAGMERADEFSHIFCEKALDVYRMRTQYCIDNCLFDLALSKEMPDKNDYLSNILVIQAMTMSGHIEEAFEKIQSKFSKGEVDEILLVYLLALSDKATGGLKAASRTLYDKYMPLYDKLIDLRDILNTGYLVDDSDKKKAKSLKSITPAQFNKQLAEDAETPYIIGMVEIFEHAAKMFEKKSMLAAALECYRSMFAACPDKSACYANMSRLFGELGNAAVAKELAKKAQ